MAHKVRATIIKAEGLCGAGHARGQEFVIDRHAPAGICMTALGALLPLIQVLRQGGEFTDGTRVLARCPDATDGITFELVRED